MSIERAGGRIRRRLTYFPLLLMGRSGRSPCRGRRSTKCSRRRGCPSVRKRSSTACRAARASGAMLGIKEYPTPTHVGMFDALLSAPFPFVLTQSFAFLTKASGQALLQRQFNRMVNAGDFAVSQAEELKDALDALTSNEFVMGDHHFSLQVLADDPSAAGRRLATSKRRASGARKVAERSRRARAGASGRYRDDGGAGGPGAGGGLLGAAAGQLPDAPAQGADHLAQLRGDGAVS